MNNAAHSRAIPIIAALAALVTLGVVTQTKVSKKTRISTRVVVLSGKGERFLSVDDFAGLAVKEPGTAALLTIFLLSLIGVPLTGGFFGKFYIFKAALSAHLVWLTVLGLLNSAVAAYYYLRILVAMYMREPSEATAELEPLSLGLRAALVIPALGTLFLGIFPAWVMDFAGKSSALVK